MNTSMLGTGPRVPDTTKPAAKTAKKDQEVYQIGRVVLIPSGINVSTTKSLVLVF
jgi:hypothetical protein